MAKTKRTAKEVEAAVESTVESTVAAASSDSKLITQSKLSYFATGFWNRIKRRYDNALNGATLTQSTNPDKKLTFTRISGTSPLEINLEDYVRIQDKNDFKQDVSSNVGLTDGTLKLGEINGNENVRRFSGHRSVTTKQFVDSYVSYLSVLADDSLVTGSNSSWTVWAVEKKLNRVEDRVLKQYDRRTVPVKEITIDGNTYKYVDLTIEEKFEKEAYFIVGFESRDKGYRVINLKQEYQNDDVVNVSTRPTVGNTIGWEPTVRNNVSAMVIHGRESIGSLSEKINKLNSDSGLYVKHSETTNTGGTATNAGKVVKLDGSGKLNKDMLPSIAINEYFEINQFTNDALRDKVYENGDVAVVPSTGKKYLCIKKDKNASTNSTSDFIELNSKDGSVLSVNEKTGAVNLELEATANELKLKIRSGNDTTNIAETSVPVVTDAEIDSIIAGLQD